MTTGKAIPESHPFKKMIAARDLREELGAAEAALSEAPIPPNFCRILEPNNPDYSERFACKDCGENFITLCSYRRLKAQLQAVQQERDALRKEIDRLDDDRLVLIALLSGLVEQVQNVDKWNAAKKYLETL